MFRRVREAARRGRTQAKGLLVKAGRVGLVGLIYAGKAVKKLWQGIDAVLMAAARTVTWTWTYAVEVYSMTEAPFTWAIGNVLWWLLRVGETVVNKLRHTNYTYMHRNFPAFTLLNAVAMNNLALYPLVALVGWILSPLSDQNWWRNLAHGYKTRTISAADWAYVERFKRDMAYDKTMGEPEASAWEAAADTVQEEPVPPRPARTGGVDEDGLTGIQRYERNMAEGWKLVWPEEGKEEGGLDYLTDRIRTSTQDEEEVAGFLFSIHQDHWGRFWAKVPDGIDLTRPAPSVVEPEEQVHAKHAPEDLDEHGLINFDITNPPEDYSQMHDPKERSYWYGVEFVTQSRRKIKNFLDSEEQQNRARAMVAKDTRNPQAGFLQHYAIKGFEEELTRAKEAASHQV